MKVETVKKVKTVKQAEYLTRKIESNLKLRCEYTFNQTDWRYDILVWFPKYYRRNKVRILVH